MNNRNLEQILNFASRQSFTNYNINVIETINIEDNANMQTMLTTNDRNRNVINYYQNMNIVSSNTTSRTSRTRDYSYREPIFIPRTNVRNPFLRTTNSLFPRSSPIRSNSITASGSNSTSVPPAPAAPAGPLPPPSLSSILDSNFNDIYRTLNNRLGGATNQPNNISYTVEISNAADLESAFGFSQNNAVTLNHLTQRTELIVLADNNITDFNEMNCSICSQEFSVGQIVRKVSSCGHFFHQACIDRWFEENSTCPICRTNLNSVESTSDPSDNTAVDPSDNGVVDPSDNTAVDPSDNGVVDPSDNTVVDPSSNTTVDPSGNRL